MRLPPLVWMYWPIFGISSTCDCTWRANSRSTFSRSARIGSKISDRAGVVFSTGLRTKTLSRAEQGMKVRGCLPGQVVPRQLVHLRQRLEHAPDVGRLVPLAAIRHRREERTVGFDEQAIERHAPHGLAQLRGLGKGQNACQRDVEAEREAGVGQRGRAREAVQ